MSHYEQVVWYSQITAGGGLRGAHTEGRPVLLTLKDLGATALLSPGVADQR